MSKGAHDMFILVIIFLGSDWKPKHVTFSLFEVAKIIGQTLAKNLIKFLDAYGLRNKIIAYVKDEGSNLYTLTLTNALKFVVKCEILGFFKELLLVMFFRKHANMPQLMTKFERT
jgi:hypothetical protein